MFNCDNFVSYKLLSGGSELSVVLKCSTEVANKSLENQAVGSYIIRHSNSEPEKFVLSFVATENRTVHTKFWKDDSNGAWVFYRSNGKGFQSEVKFKSFLRLGEVALAVFKLSMGLHVAPKHYSPFDIGFV